MKHPVRYLIPALGLIAAWPVLRAADTAPAPKDDKKDLRVLAPAGHTRTFMREVAKETVAFLGVQTQPISRTVSAQLGLNGQGLTVEHVVPDTPAAAVLQDDDILLKLDDQILIARTQLEVLVRMHKEGDEVTLTYLRGGKQATAKVKLAKHDVPKMSAVLKAFPSIAFSGSGGDLAQAFASATGKFELAAPRPPEADREDVDRELSLIQPGNGSPMRIEIRRGEGDGGYHAMGVNTANSALSYSDDAGSLELTIKDGEKSLVAKDKQGTEVFRGPVTTAEQRKAMPAEVRGRLEKLEGMQDVTFHTDGLFRGAETRVFRADPSTIAYPLPPPAPPRASPFF